MDDLSNLALTISIYVRSLQSLNMRQATTVSVHMVVYQPGPEIEVDISKIKFAKSQVEVPEAIHKVHHSDTGPQPH